MSIEEYFGDWLSVIDRKELFNVMSIVGKEYKTRSVCPPQPDVFKAFKVCPLNELKVVMLFQDPYPQKGIATGIALGNNKNTEDNKLSTSLNVVKEAVMDFEIPHNCCTFDPSLESWAKQGVLLLNSALTVETNRIGSHVMLWRPFISTLLKKLSEQNTASVYVLFGKQAQTFKPYINSKLNYIIEVEHPAYYARTNTKMSHNIFLNINNKVKDIYGTSIEWYTEY